MFKRIPADSRRTFLPIGRSELYEHYKLQQSKHWTPASIQTELDKDYGNFIKLRPSEQKMLKFTLILFEYIDVVASKVFGDQGYYIGELAEIPEVKIVMNYQTMIEDVHSLQYSLLIETYIPDSEERSLYRNHIENFPFVAKLLEWTSANINRNDVATNLQVMSLVEGVMISGLFAIIFAYGELLGLRIANEYISADEGFHHATTGLLNNILEPEHRLPFQKAKSITEKFLELLFEYMKQIIPDDSPRGINYQKMCQYLHYKADDNYELMKYKRIYKTPNPFTWMAKYDIASHTAPHERKVTNYSSIDTIQAKISADDVNSMFDIIKVGPIKKRKIDEKK